MMLPKARELGFLLLRKFTRPGNCNGNRLPIIYLVDSAGVYLPLQEKFFQTKNILDAFLEIMHK
jgi:hypothetical protein